MAIRDVVLLGFGANGSIPQVVTLGFFVAPNVYPGPFRSVAGQAWSPGSIDGQAHSPGSVAAQEHSPGSKGGQST